VAPDKDKCPCWPETWSREAQYEALGVLSATLTLGLLQCCPSLGNNTQIPAKDRFELLITFEHAVHSAVPPDTLIL